MMWDGIAFALLANLLSDTESFVLRRASAIA